MELRFLMRSGLFVILLVVVQGSDLEFTSSSTSFQSPMTKNLTLKCSLTDSASPSAIVGRDLTHTDDDVMYLNSIVVTKDGKDIASMSEHVAAQVLGNIPNLQVTGRISSNQAEKGYIELHWVYPKAGDAGTYKCDVTGVDQQGHAFSYFKTIDITESDVTISDLASQIGSIKHLVDLLTSQVNTLQAERYSGGSCGGLIHCAGNLQCLNGTCGCPNGQYLVNDDNCTAELNPGAACEKTEQCTGVLHCLTGICKCPEGFSSANNICTIVHNTFAREFIYYGKSGEITSLNYPHPYIDNMYFRYIIQAEAGKVVNLTFTNVNMESHDYVEVFDGRDNLSRQIVTVNSSGGTSIGKVFTSTSNVLFLQFRTDGSAHSYRGFRATFNTST